MYVDIDSDYSAEDENIEWSIINDETLGGLEDTEISQ
jgi:hypothetical protein